MDTKNTDNGMFEYCQNSTNTLIENIIITGHEKGISMLIDSHVRIILIKRNLSRQKSGLINTKPASRDHHADDYNG